jgi:hypothetical protein
LNWKEELRPATVRQQSADSADGHLDDDRALVADAQVLRREDEGAAVVLGDDLKAVRLRDGDDLHQRPMNGVGDGAALLGWPPPE